MDTSVWISAELGRPIDRTALPDEAVVCVITIAELEAGLLAAGDNTARARRLDTLRVALDSEVLPVDAQAAHAWAELRVRLHESGRRLGVNDLWIAAVAVSNDLPVITQDGGFDPLADLGALRVIRV